MTAFWNLNLIHLFDFYLALMFLLNSYRRFEQYRAFGGLMLAVPGRWPRLLELIRRHSMVFLTWPTLAPLGLALLLIIIQVIASRFLWPSAQLTMAGLADRPVAWPIVLISGVGMVSVDLYFVLIVSQIDRPSMEKYFDEAEFWLRSWTSPVVHVVTLGRINPRQLVTTEVQKALREACQFVNATLWWVVAQIGLRVLFGLSLWLSWALA